MSYISTTSRGGTCCEKEALSVGQNMWDADFSSSNYYCAEIQLENTAGQNMSGVVCSLLFLTLPVVFPSLFSRLITVTENRGGTGRDRFFLFDGGKNDNGTVK